MDNREVISLLSTLITVTLVVAVIFFIATVVMFFAFRIPQIYMLRTGKAQRKAVNKLQQVNASTGSLSAASKEHGISGIFGSSADLDSSAVTTEIKANVGYDENRSANDPADQQVGETSVLKPQPEEIVPDQSYGKFNVVKNVLEIHTEECIV